MFSFHVIVAILSHQGLGDARFPEWMNILVLADEFCVLDWLRYFSYDLGRQIAAFVMLVLTVIWNLTPPASSRRSPRIGWAAGARGNGGDPDERDRGGGSIWRCRHRPRE